MYEINRKIRKKGMLIAFAALFSTFGTVWAESDMQLMEKALKIREGRDHKGMDHSAHAKSQDASKIFRGVFYGYLPCDQKDCDGIKTTLSLKQKNNYLLVTQYAKASTREYYEKGKYVWDEQNRLLTLTPKKKEAKRLYSIQDETSLIQLNVDGTPLAGNSKDYTLQRSDSIKSRQVHIH
ncbi:copper resistance protein NlpE [Methylomarinum vadi]|uniref:copper resistance protein NlpE n=1 Tax=Methylomarinum vadi TaxID=438855 RepID=UPI0004DF3E4C|nr:copper resistance protein NlpE [Methylomarinum vadi]